MTHEEIANIRLENQQITSHRFSEPAGIVSWMGAMQAQDLPMSLWAVGMRTKSSSVSSVLNALDVGKILRTHVMRPTWHLVTPEDIHWMLELTSGQIKKRMVYRNRQLELDLSIIGKCIRLFEKALSGKKDISRSELGKILQENKIRIDENRLSHLLLEAELEGIICSGRIIKGRQNYALLETRAPLKKKLNREEALAALGEKYFQSHAPASLKDFTWWSGLSPSDVRKVPDLISNKFRPEKSNGREFYLPSTYDSSQKMKKNKEVFLLPAYDEFLIGYSDRSASLTLAGETRHVSTNGIFYPVIIRGGQVIGFWKRRTLKNDVSIEFNFIGDQVEAVQKMAEKRLERYKSFLKD